MAKISVLVADGSRLLTESLAAALRWNFDMEVIEEFPESGPQTLEIACRFRPDVALIDFWMPDMEGAALAATLRNRVPKTKVILLSLLHSPGDIERALASGAVGFLPKSTGVDGVAEAVRRARAGENPVFAAGLKQLGERIRQREAAAARINELFATLSPREMEVLRLFSYGWSINQVAKKLSLSPGTVKQYSHKILQRTGAETRERAIAMARYSGLIRG